MEHRGCFGTEVVAAVHDARDASRLTNATDCDAWQNSAGGVCVVQDERGCVCSQDLQNARWTDDALVECDWDACLPPQRRRIGQWLCRNRLLKIFQVILFKLAAQFQRLLRGVSPVRIDPKLQPV